ncbi:MAG: hypothetical protein E7620_01090 [Ruminococcaceae bacterium]|nr:hypothetical protein [Oscillospiraceae bacterium]
MATFTNKATLSYSGRTTESNTVTGTLPETLTVTKQPLSDTYAPGGTVTYAITLINDGAVAQSGLTLTDNLGAYELTEGVTVYPLTYVGGTLTYYVNGVLQATPTIDDAVPLTVSGLSVPAGGNGILLYQATANGFAPLEAGGSIVNTVTLQSVGGEVETASATVLAEADAQLSIVKSLSPTTVPENGRVTYTFQILNTGNEAAVATDNVTVTDLFQPILNDITVTLNGAVLEEGSGYTYDEATGLFTTVPSVITVPAATYVLGEDGYTVVPGSAVLTVTGTI